MKNTKIYSLRLGYLLKHFLIIISFLTGFCCSWFFYTPTHDIFTASGLFYMPQNTLLSSDLRRVSSVLPLSRTRPDSASSQLPQASASPEPGHISITTASANLYTPSNGIYVQNDTDYYFDIESLIAKPLNLQNPSVLIYHTHTSEAYTPSPDYTYTQSDPYRSENPEYNVTHIGEVVASVLKNKGINVIHDKTSHDYPSYSGSYDRSLETIEKNLAENPSIQIVLDIHRDAIADSDGNYLKTYAEINGASCAQALIVVGTDRGGLTHPDWQENLSLGLRLQSVMLSKYPGLARPLHLREERFNGHSSHGALLIEIGSNGNTMEEAIKCAEYVAESIASLLGK